MKIIDVIINPNYSCNVCGKIFVSKEELNLNFLVICSKKCEFKFIYRLLQKQGYDIKNLENLYEIIKKIPLGSKKNLEPKDLTSHFYIYELTKYYHKIGLSNIKHLGSRLNTKAQGSKNGLRLIISLCNREMSQDLSLTSLYNKELIK